MGLPSEEIIHPYPLPTTLHSSSPSPYHPTPFLTLSLQPHTLPHPLPTPARTSIRRCIMAGLCEELAVAVDALPPAPPPLFDPLHYHLCIALVQVHHGRPARGVPLRDRQLRRDDDDHEQAARTVRGGWLPLGPSPPHRRLRRGQVRETKDIVCRPVAGSAMYYNHIYRND